MSRARILRAARVILAVFVIALVALEGAAARSGATKANGGTLVIGLSRGDPDTLDPSVTAAFSSVEVLRSICDRLYDFNARSQVVPELAKGLPRISKSRLTYTIPLRRGIRFNDGTPFNATAVAASLLRDIQLPTSQRASDLSPIARITTRGSYAVVIHLKAPYTSLPETLATNDGIVMSPQQLAKLGANFGSDPVCVGPFMFANRVAGYSVTVVKSPYYYKRSAVHLDDIVFKTESDPAAAIAALEAGDVQALDSVAPTELSALRADKKVQLIKRDSLGWSGIVVNIANQGIGKPFANAGTPLATSPALRHAFEEAIDRNALVRVVYQGTAVAGCTPVAPASPGYDPSIKCTPYDPKAAAKLVKQSGNPNPTVHFLVPTTTVNLRLAQFLQAEEAAVGINVVIDSRDNPTALAQETHGSFDTALAGWTGTPDTDRNVYQFVDSAGSRNIAGYSNPRLDQILEQAREAQNPKALYHQAFKILLNARPIIFLDHPTVYAAVSTNVKNVLFYSDIQLRPGFARIG